MGTLTIRTDRETERVLEELTAQGLSKSEVAREAILEAGRAHRRELMREEAQALRDDPQERAAAKALAAEMDEISAW
ncbi:MAG: hypothetical protein LKI24_16580 [Acidipropionibacterium sp.]|jgi:hypothetical protein|nr:hypothetical protein [Acidipropionibacterium sp.]